jgi:hypothetical protein
MMRMSLTALLALMSHIAIAQEMPKRPPLGTEEEIRPDPPKTPPLGSQERPNPDGPVVIQPGASDLPARRLERTNDKRRPPFAPDEIR